MPDGGTVTSSTDNIERWALVPGFACTASTLGRIKGPSGRALKPQPDGDDGYLCVDVARNGGARKPFKVHRLVLLAFRGPAPEGKPHGLHWNDDKADNALGNLRWGSDADNAADRVRNRTAKSAERESRRAERKARHEQAVAELAARGLWT